MPGSDELVEFAIRLPASARKSPCGCPSIRSTPWSNTSACWMRRDAADKTAIQSAGNAFESSIKLEAKKDLRQHVSPPHTTDFAVLYLPTEGLFAEVMRRPGLVEAMQNEAA